MLPEKLGNTKTIASFGARGAVDLKLKSIDEAELVKRCSVSTALKFIAPIEGETMTVIIKRKRETPGFLTILPALFGNFATGTLMFMSYDFARVAGGGSGPAGAFAGAITSLLTVPLEAVKEAPARHEAASWAVFKFRRLHWGGGSFVKVPT